VAKVRDHHQNGRREADDVEKKGCRGRQRMGRAHGVELRMVAKT
jgi:hypothetical protein